MQVFQRTGSVHVEEVPMEERVKRLSTNSLVRMINNASYRGYYHAEYVLLCELLLRL